VGERSEQGQGASVSQERAGMSTRAQIILALLSLVGVLGAALIEHWADLFGHRERSQFQPTQMTEQPNNPPPRHSADTLAASPPNLQAQLTPTPKTQHAADRATVGVAVNTTGSDSPVVSNVTGNVTINIGADSARKNGPDQGQGGTQPRLLVMDMVGDWKSEPFMGAYDDSKWVVILHFKKAFGEIIGTLTEVSEERGKYPTELYEIKSDGSVVSFETRGVSCCDGHDQPEPYRTLYTVRRTDDGFAVARHNTVLSGGKTERFMLHRDSPNAAGAAAGGPDGQR
jgi:hypothetical protein